MSIVHVAQSTDCKCIVKENLPTVKDAEGNAIFSLSLSVCPSLSYGFSLFPFCAEIRLFLALSCYIVSFASPVHKKE